MTQSHRGISTFVHFNDSAVHQGAAFLLALVKVPLNGQQVLRWPLSNQMVDKIQRLVDSVVELDLLLEIALEGTHLHLGSLSQSDVKRVSLSRDLLLSFSLIKIDSHANLATINQRWGPGKLVSIANPHVVVVLLQSRLECGVLPDLLEDNGLLIRVGG